MSRAMRKYAGAPATVLSLPIGGSTPSATVRKLMRRYCSALAMNPLCALWGFIVAADSLGLHVRMLDREARVYMNENREPS